MVKITTIVLERTNEQGDATASRRVSAGVATRWPLGTVAYGPHPHHLLQVPCGVGGVWGTRTYFLLLQ